MPISKLIRITAGLFDWADLEHVPIPGARMRIGLTHIITSTESGRRNSSWWKMEMRVHGGGKRGNKNKWCPVVTLFKGKVTVQDPVLKQLLQDGESEFHGPQDLPSWKHDQDLGNLFPVELYPCCICPAVSLVPRRMPACSKNTLNICWMTDVIDIEFQFGVMIKFWRWIMVMVVQQFEHT